ncbi:MAG TPA: transketolase C-terminal domain-containing protein [Nannocystaceae bacterium]|nr:transketolase C-terminal domain-containing protein [Nannocystaceae bacterium]
MNVASILADVLAELLRDDPSRVLLGEDVTTGGMLGLSRACASDPELARRLIATPLVPTVALAHAGGLALAGLRPIVLLPGLFAAFEGLAGLREVAAMAWRTAGDRTAPVLVVAPCGPGFGLGGDAGEGLESVLVRVPGLRVVCVGRPHDAAPMLRAAAEFEASEDPIVLLVPRTILAAELDGSSRAELTRQLHAAQRVRIGAAATVFAWGEGVELALEAVAETGVDATVVDVASLRPLDRETIVEAARDTGKIVVVHAGPPGGVGAELAGLVADEAIDWLDGPIVRVGGDEPPLAAGEELRGLPTVERIARALERVTTW